ncbi:relaxase/mobilization nuclease domain-containing protein [Flagellimonas sp. CMM7]|uniref:relaxase/mobilization nuclease domain-containing protein n=1 Tax=Flagellimonas sp. CMM7 TaxID=2654676 RepID=UPI0013D890A3|nr:relaxase/mobilization nuclease domain-containing protein [Flagellimonas sp. CMM7]UII81264.1 relaxase/mobilization nuclease domain-containing protein [Flagellimonas sp. CMM7]
MIGKGKSISHTKASISYGWNQEKDAEIIQSQHLAGENPREITEEFRIVQSQNPRTKKNTLSFVLSPSIEDGNRLSKQELSELAKKFIKAMGLKERQAIAFVHRDKEHTHIHLYANRIGFDGKAYKDSFIGKRSQQKAYEVAREMGLTNARDIQNQRLNQVKQIRYEIKQIHEKVIQSERPKSLDDYIKLMKEKDIKVIPSINKQNKLQGFRFEHKGQNLKGSEVHRSMSGGKLISQISDNLNKGIAQQKNPTLKLAGKAIELSTNIATALAKRFTKKIIKKSIDQGIGI